MNKLQCAEFSQEDLVSLFDFVDNCVVQAVPSVRVSINFVPHVTRIINPSAKHKSITNGWYQVWYMADDGEQLVIDEKVDAFAKQNPAFVHPINLGFEVREARDKREEKEAGFVDHGPEAAMAALAQAGDPSDDEHPLSPVVEITEDTHPKVVELFPGNVCSASDSGSGHSKCETVDEDHDDPSEPEEPQDEALDTPPENPPVQNDPANDKENDTP